MQTAKEILTEIIAAQPEDATVDELIHEILFNCMIDRGLADVAAGRVISHEEMLHEIDSWPE